MLNLLLWSIENVITFLTRFQRRLQITLRDISDNKRDEIIAIDYGYQLCVVYF